MDNFFERYEKNIYIGLGIILIVTLGVWCSRLNDHSDLKRIVFYIQTKKYGTATEYLENFSRRKQSSDGYALLSLLFLKMGLQKEASNLSQIMNNFIYKIYSDCGKYNSYTSSQCYSRAEEFAKKASQLQPKNINVLCMLGLVSIAKKSFEESKNYFQEAIAAAENRKEKSLFYTLMAIAGALQVKEKFSNTEYSEAISNIKTALEFDSQNDKAYEVYGDLLAMQADTRELAEEYYQKAITVSENTLIERHEANIQGKEFKLNLLEHIFPSEVRRKIKYNK